MQEEPTNIGIIDEKYKKKNKHRKQEERHYHLIFYIYIFYYHHFNMIMSFFLCSMFSSSFDLLAFMKIYFI